MRGLKIGKQANSNKPGLRQKEGLLKKKDTKDGSDSVNVDTYDTASGVSSARTVKKGSPAAKVAKEYGREVTFGKSADQKVGKKPAKKADIVKGTNRNTSATMSTYGDLSPNFKGRAKDSKGNTVDFSTNNNDSRRKEKFRLF